VVNPLFQTAKLFPFLQLESEKLTLQNEIASFNLQE
jgi:hypothetical protein